MRVTQKDIARKLELSPSLVAGVLNDRPNVWVSEENRRRIVSTAKEMNYRPNAAARALRSGKTNVVTCVFFGSPGNNAIAEVLAESLTNIGYDLLVKMVRDPAQAKRRIDSMISRSACDAFILWGHEKDIEESALLLANEQIPFVVKGHFEESHPDWCQVDFDHVKMMEHVVEHLHSLGHKRIAYMGYQHGLVYEKKLLEGYQRGMERISGEAVLEDYIMAANKEQNNPDEEPDVVEDELERLMSLPEGKRPTAIAMGAGLDPWRRIELTLAKWGLKIGLEPEDIAVAGTGGEETPLLFGEGYMYKDTDVTKLADIIATQLLSKLLSGEKPENNILLSLPSLIPHPSLRLRFY
jgi:LacI family transcriptional regulator